MLHEVRELRELRAKVEQRHQLLAALLGFNVARLNQRPEVRTGQQPLGAQANRLQRLNDGACRQTGLLVLAVVVLHKAVCLGHQRVDAAGHCNQGFAGLDGRGSDGGEDAAELVDCLAELLQCSQAGHRLH